MSRFSQVLRLLALQAPLLFGMWTHAGAAQPIPSAVVVDSTGKVLGPLIDPYGYSSVLLPMKPGQPPISAPFETDGFVLDSDYTVFWTTGDCTGTAYMYTQLIAHAGFASTYGNTLWFPDTQAVPKRLALHSTTRNSRCISKPGIPATVVPAKPIDVDSLGFTPPFMIDLR